MTRDLTFILTRPARKNGGDRYEADMVEEEKPVVFYFPQSISRVAGEPLDKLKVTVSGPA